VTNLLGLLDLGDVPPELRPYLEEIALLCDEASEREPEVQAEVRKVLEELCSRLLPFTTLYN
jgi:hypothetical protein